MKKIYIYADNYRGFKSAVIPLSQVNFLVGENSTGKTSFLELIDILSDMSFWAFEPRFGSPAHPQRHFLDLVSASSPSKRQFTVGSIQLASDPNESIGCIVTFVNFDGRPMPSRVSIYQGERISTLDGQLWRAGKIVEHRHRTKICPNRDHDLTAERISQLVASHHSGVGFKAIEKTDERSIGPLYMRYHDLLFPDIEVFEDRKVLAPYLLMSNYVELAPIRTKPKRTYDAPQTEFSPEGAHTPYVIRKRLASKTQAEAFTRFIESAGSSSGLFKSIKLKQYGKDQMAPFELQVVLGKSALGIENVGYGVSQALPVLVEMFTRPKRSAFLIQQPEVHLHPRAQATFGDLTAELARTDEKRFFIETHSDFAIDRFRLNVRKNGAIDAQLLFFQRAEAGNEVFDIPVLSDGGLSDDQLQGYREFFFNESLSLLS